MNGTRKALTRLGDVTFGDDLLRNKVSMAVQAIDNLSENDATLVAAPMEEAAFEAAKVAGAAALSAEEQSVWNAKVDYRWACRPTLKKRLNQLVKRYLGSELSGRQRKRMVHRLTEARNAASHSRASEQAGDAGEILHQGRGLLTLMILDRIGVDWKAVLRRNPELRSWLGLPIPREPH